MLKEYAIIAASFVLALFLWPVHAFINTWTEINAHMRRRFIFDNFKYLDEITEEPLRRS